MQHEAWELEGVGERYLRALSTLDFASVESCFRPDVDFRALVPPGVREASDASGAAGYMRRWFGDADSLEVLWSEVGSIAHRRTIAYRVRVARAGRLEGRGAEAVLRRGGRRADRKAGSPVLGLPVNGWRSSAASVIRVRSL